MTYVALTIAGTDVEVIDVIRRLNRVQRLLAVPALALMPSVTEPPPEIMPSAPGDPEPALMSDVERRSADWNAATARRALAVAAGNTKQLMDALLEAPNFSIPDHDAMILLGTHGRGIGAIKRSLDGIRRKVQPDARPIIRSADDGVLELDPSFANAVVAGV